MVSHTTRAGPSQPATIDDSEYATFAWVPDPEGNTWNFGNRSMDVVLIGPIAAGKSTLGNLLSVALGLPQGSIDDVRFRYYSEIGYVHGGLLPRDGCAEIIGRIQSGAGPGR